MADVLLLATLVLASILLYIYFAHFDTKKRKVTSDSAVPRGPWYPRILFRDVPDDMRPTLKLYALNWVWKLLGLIVFGALLWFIGRLLYG